MQPRNMHGRGDWVTIALAAGAIATGLVAIVVVVGLFWWADSLSWEPLRRAAAPAPGAQHALRDGPATGSGAPTPVAVPRAETRSRAAAPQAVAAAQAPTPPAPDAPQANSDAAKNRAIADALSRLGADPDAARRFGVPP